MIKVQFLSENFSINSGNFFRIIIVFLATIILQNRNNLFSVSSTNPYFDSINASRLIYGKIYSYSVRCRLFETVCFCFPIYCLSIFMKTIKIIIGLSLSWSQGMIIPGTNYCGSGELESKDEDPLYPETDNCCQKHDYCQIFLKFFQTKIGLLS